MTTQLVLYGACVLVAVFVVGLALHGAAYWIAAMASRDSLRCANCGRRITDTRIGGGTLSEGEACCSVECYDEHEDKGCPLETGGYRAKPPPRGSR